MKFLKVFFVIGFALMCTLTLKSQVGVRISYIKPSGNFGYVFKPTIGFEGYFDFTENDEQLRFGIGIGYFNLTPRIDTFPTYTIMSSNTTTLLPGYETYKYFYSIPMSMNIEYKIFDNVFSPVVGCDVYLHMFIYEYTHETETLIHEEFTGGTYAIGWHPRLGFSYDFQDEITLNGSLGKCMSIDQNYSLYSYWKTSLSVIYYF